MMPPDDDNEEQRIRRAKRLFFPIFLADQDEVSRAVHGLETPRAPDLPLYQSLCVFLI
jgi:hypothetical protein